MNDLVQPPMASPYHASYSSGYGQVPSQGLSPQWQAQQQHPHHPHQTSSRPTSQSYQTSPVYSLFGNVPSSYNSDNSDMEWSQDNNAGSGQGPDASAFSSVTARRAHVVEWITKTNLTPAQVQIARNIISSKWWEKEDPEPELRPDDPLITSKLIHVVGGSRFKAFLDEENGYKCTFDHDGVPCHHGKGRTERALGTIRGFFRYKPVMCNGSCGTRCNQRFVSVEQCQKHVQKKRSGRAACPDCGSAILPANMSRHRRACHSNDGGASSRP
ncbi:hypothetical protein CPB86DRAFT_782418 [Serendipita vermifera]|nr:hypothetical protein CPB86DRAFT_782418 [Serendipita vermifera]